MAECIYSRYKNKINDADAFFLGNLAPDTISSMPGCQRQDKLYVHLRNGISDIEWLNPDQMAIFDERKDELISRFILADDIEPSQKSFNIGYLAHLLTDKCNHMTLRQKVLKVAITQGLTERNYGFFGMIINDLDALDAYLLDSRPEIAALFERITSRPAEHGLPGYIEKEYINGSMVWWKEQYLPAIRQRELITLGHEDIDWFVDYAARAVAGELTEYGIL